MKLRNLVLLVILAGALITWVVWSMRAQTQSATMPIGTKVMPGLPVNQVHKIVITTADESVTLAKDKDLWTVASRFKYPAAFDKIVECLLQLSEMKVGQVMIVNESQKGALQVLDPAMETPLSRDQKGKRVELRDKNDGLLGAIVIGKPFMRSVPEDGMQGPLAMGSYPDGQYLQTADGEVLLVAQNLDRLTSDPKSWFAGDLISVAADDIRELASSGPDRARIRLVRPEENAPFELEGLKETEGTLDGSKVNQISGALNMLGFDDIADPTLPPNKTGLNNPVVFEARTRQGRVYTVRIGNTLTNDTFDRYAQVAVTWLAPATPAKPDDSPGRSAPAEPGGQPTPPNAGQATDLSRAATDARPQTTQTNMADTAEAGQRETDQAKALNDRLASWVFALKSYRVEPLLIKREELIKKPEPTKPDDGQQKTDTGSRTTESMGVVE